MKNSDYHNHIMKTLYKLTAFIMFLAGIVITVRLTMSNLDVPKYLIMIQNPGDIFAGVAAFLGGFYFLYRYIHYDEDKEGD